MATTVKDIAVRVGVSPMTVSRALLGTGRMSAETRQRIIRSAQELGYRPNASAKAMRSGCFRSLGLLTSVREEEGVIHPPMLRGMREELRSRDLHLIIGDLPDEKLVSHREMPRILREWAVDGLLINYTTHIPQPIFQIINDYALPAIWVNVKLANDCIHPDDLGAGRRATQMLLAAGHRRIAFVRHRPRHAHYSHEDRPAGYEAAMCEAGLIPRRLEVTNVLRGEDLYAFGRTLLTAEDRPTALVTDQAGILSTLMVLGGELAMRVPRDLAVVALRDRLDNVAGVDITTLSIPFEAVGRLAVPALLEKISRPSDPLPPVAVPFELALGETCVPPGI